MKTLHITMLLSLAATQGRGDAPGRITLNTAGENIRTVLAAIADQSGHNLVIPDSVQRTIAVHLRDVTFKEALNAVLLVNGLNHVIQNRTILVFPFEEAERLQAMAPPPPLGARVIDLRHVPVKSVKPAVEGLLSARGKVLTIAPPPAQRWEMVDGFLAASGTRTAAGAAPQDRDDAHAYRVLIVDEEERLDAIAAIIAAIDVKPRQVYVSAVLFEIGVNQEEEIGLRWRIRGSITPSSLPWNFPFGHGNLGEYSPHVSPSDDLYPGPQNRGMFPDSRAEDFLFGRIAMSGTELLLELHQLGADLNLISNPRLMVADRQEAIILVGERYPLLQSTITDQGTVTETFDRYEPIGVQLRVVPHIQQDNEVAMLIEPQITSIGATITGTTGLSYPRITTRRVESTIRVTDGESVVIAGLVSERERVEITAVPLLADIPILGHLFRHKASIIEKVNLVVVVTPYIDRVPTAQDLESELERLGARRKAP